VTGVQTCALPILGKAHAKTIQSKVRAAEIVAACDVDQEKAKEVSELGDGVRIHKDYTELVNSDEIDAVVVAVPAALHTDTILAAVRAGKPVFSEKPLANTARECKQIVDAEIAGGKRLVQVAFMKRYDKGYTQIKELIESGGFGAPLVVKTTQRAGNISVSYPYYKNEMQITDSIIHDIDLLPWLLGDDEWDEVQSLTSRTTKNASEGLQDPLVVIMKTKNGVLCVVEHFVNTGFVGFEVTAEIVCEDGIINLPGPSAPITRTNSQLAIAIEPDWLIRFENAYDIEIQDWVERALEGTAGGSSAWDGFTAAITADALIASQKSGKPEKVITGETPDFYVKN